MQHISCFSSKYMQHCSCMTSDTLEIRRSVDLPAPIAEVWKRSFATAEAFSTWFPEALSGTLAVGERLSHMYEGQTYTMTITEFEAQTVLAFRWHPGEKKPEYTYQDSEMTEVRITLEPVGEKTRVTIHETGFENIPLSRRSAVIGDNTGGWEYAANTLATNYAQ